MTKRFVVTAVCIIAGSSLTDQTCNLWSGASRASAERATKRLKEIYGHLYRDWTITEVT